MNHIVQTQAIDQMHFLVALDKTRSRARLNNGFCVAQAVSRARRRDLLSRGRRLGQHVVNHVRILKVVTLYQAACFGVFSIIAHNALC